MWLSNFWTIKVHFWFQAKSLTLSSFNRSCPWGWGPWPWTLCPWLHLPFFSENKDINIVSGSHVSMIMQRVSARQWCSDADSNRGAENSTSSRDNFLGRSEPRQQAFYRENNLPRDVSKTTSLVRYLILRVQISRKEWETGLGLDCIGYLQTVDWDNLRNLRN